MLSSVRLKRAYQRLFDWVIAGLLPPVFIGVLKLLYRTLRWEIEGRENVTPFWDGGRPVIMAFWHGRLLFMPGLWEKKGKAHVLIGRHRNGELIARVIGGFGLGSVRGSSNAGGPQARQAMMERFYEGGGQTLGFTPDGPHGPRYVSKLGMAALSRKLNLPVIWISASASRSVTVPVWDRFLIPLPFSRACVHWSPPVDPAAWAHLELEGWREVLDHHGRTYQLRTDRRAGRRDPVDHPLLERSETALAKAPPV